MRIRGLRAAGASCGLGLLVSCAQPGATDRPPPQTHTVVMEGLRFRPDTVTVNAGDSLVWVNRDLVPHSATSAVARFDSRAIGADRSWRVSLSRPGDFEYVCSFHPTMKARVRVR